MKKILFSCSVGLFAFSLFMACTKSATDEVQPDGISDAVKAKIAALGFGTQGIVRADKGYIVEGDILLTENELNAAPASPNMIIAKEEHYRTFNTVRGLPRTLTVSVTSSAPSYFFTATDEAIRRYNAENLQLKFTRVTGTADINIVVYYEQSNVLGSAGFPSSSGNPYPEIRMNSYHYSSSTNTNYLASIIAHEMGHCIGYRHTDYMRRSYSCGYGGNEGQTNNGVGAVHIPGTPTGPDARSWMLACSNGTDRPFTANDKIALGYVY